MTWVRLDDAILDNPKIVRAGPIGFAVHVAAITWCARNLTDGFVPEAKAKHLLGHTWIEDQDDGRSKIWELNASCGMCGIDGPSVTEKVIEHLIECGLWVEDRDDRGNFGYLVHDYLEYNPSKAEVIELKAKRQAAGSIGGKERQANAKAKFKQSSGKGEAKLKLARAHAGAHAPASDLRSPVPGPSERSEILSSLGEGSESGVHPVAEPKRSAELDFVHEVFEFWKLDTGKLKAKLDKKRTARILARRRDGFTVEELKAAIRNRRNDPWLMGETANGDGKKYDELESLLKDVAKVERLRDLTEPIRAPVKRGGPGPVQPTPGVTGFEKARSVQ
jgi:hypothetical protein